MNPMDLSGKVILVTGASSGIGRACAVLAANLGATLILTGRREAMLDETRTSLQNSSNHLCIPADLSSSGSVEKIVSTATNRSRLDGLVHAAGLELAVPIKLTELGDARKLYEVNSLAFLELVKACVGRRTANVGFSAVAVSSVAALAGGSGYSAYAASKGALSACVRALAIELAPRGCRVNAVCPSNINTPMLTRLTEGMGEEYVTKAILHKQPLGIGQPEQVASAVCFLLSSAASFITGVNLPVDGGYLAQ